MSSALDLYSQATIRRRLNICAQGLASDDLLARSGVTEARRRLGPIQKPSATECDDPAQQGNGADLPGVWGSLLAYNIIRREARRLLPLAFGRLPCDIRFKPVAQYIAVQLIVMAAANPISATRRRLSELRAGIGGLFPGHRPRPSRPTTLRNSKTRYPVDLKAAPLK